MFMTKTIDEILFAGYDIPFLFQIDAEKKAKYPSGKYGLMHGVCIVYIVYTLLKSS